MMKKIFYILAVGLLFIQNTISQSTLEINAVSGYHSPYNVESYFSVDDSVIEESGCGLPFDGHLYIFIIDTNCQFLETNYGGGNPDNDFGNIMGCRSRPEKYFQYRQADPSDMASLDSLINFWIPNGYTFGIYSWRTYNYDTINYVCPALAQTITNSWGSSYANDHEAVIFYGVKGDILSYDAMYTDVTPDSIHMTKSICGIATSGIVDENDAKFISYPNPFTNSITINGINSPTEVKLYNALGEVIGVWTMTENNSTINTVELRDGIYFLRIDDRIIKLIKNR